MIVASRRVRVTSFGVSGSRTSQRFSAELLTRHPESNAGELGNGRRVVRKIKKIEKCDRKVGETARTESGQASWSCATYVNQDFRARDDRGRTIGLSRRPRRRKLAIVQWIPPMAIKTRSGRRQTKHFKNFSISRKNEEHQLLFWAHVYNFFLIFFIPLSSDRYSVISPVNNSIVSEIIIIIIILTF